MVYLNESGILESNVNARVILTVNVELENRRVIGQLDTIKHLLKDSNNSVKIYAVFGDCQAGLKSMSKDAFASQNLRVQIESAEANIRIRSNKDTSLVIDRASIFWSISLMVIYVMYPRCRRKRKTEVLLVHLTE